MKKTQLFSIMALIVITMAACSKTKICRTCTARANGTTIATQEACSSQAEDDFATQYYYAETSCR